MKLWARCSWPLTAMVDRYARLCAMVGVWDRRRSGQGMPCQNSTIGQHAGRDTGHSRAKSKRKNGLAKTVVYRHQSRVCVQLYRRLDSGTAQRPSAYQMEHLSTPTRAMMCSAPTGLLHAQQLASFFGSHKNAESRPFAWRDDLEVTGGTFLHEHRNAPRIRGQPVLGERGAGEYRTAPRSSVLRRCYAADSSAPPHLRPDLDTAGRRCATNCGARRNAAPECGRSATSNACFQYECA